MLCGKDYTSAIIPDNNLGDKTKYARQVFDPLSEFRSFLWCTSSALFDIVWAVYCLFLSRRIKGQIIVTAKWGSLLIAQCSWFKARCRFFSNGVYLLKHMDKDGSFQFKITTEREVMFSSPWQTKKGTKWRQWRLNYQHEHIIDVNVGCVTSWCHSHFCFRFLTECLVAACSEWNVKSGPASQAEHSLQLGNSAFLCNGVL